MPISSAPKEAASDSLSLITLSARGVRPLFSLIRTVSPEETSFSIRPASFSGVIPASERSDEAVPFVAFNNPMRRCSVPMPELCE